jgi:rhodanese-related sulfurtransferase
MLALEDGMSRKHPKSNSRSSTPISHRPQKNNKPKLTWLWVSLAVLLVSVAGFLLFKPKATLSVEITPAQAFAKFKQGAFILDVRSQEEWDQYHITGSTLIPLEQLADRVSELPLDQEIVVVCRSGHRSQSGAADLLQAGFNNVSSLEGGLQAWTSAGYPFEGTAP